MVEEYKLYIDGAWRASGSGELMPAVNPFNQETWAMIPVATPNDVNDALVAARRAFDQHWQHTTPGERAGLLNRLADLLDKNADRMALLETTDNGKVIRETKAQMGYSANIIRFFAGYADKLAGDVIPLNQKDVLDFTMRVPYGVVAAITAWNSPIVMAAGKLGGALAAGNCMVLKPSEHASATTLELARLVDEAGFPPGVFNVVTGEAAVGRALVESRLVDKVSFTGSPQVGAKIAAAAGANLRPSALELGGKSPNIIFADADLDKAIVGGLAGIFGATGQTCIAGSRLLVQRPVYQQVVDALAARAERIRMGDPRSPETEMGTVANRLQFDRIMGFIDEAGKEGATLVTGGRAARDGDLANGLFIQPTIFSDVHNGMRLAREEIFGPVLSIIPFDTEEEAVAVANDSPFGLASGVWTESLPRAMRMIRALHTGVVWVNTYRTSAPQAPFGGMKDSGFGRERGEQGLAEFTTTKNVMIDFSDNVRDPFAMKFD